MTGSDTNVTPVEYMAWALKAYSPAGTLAHAMQYGAAVADPNKVAPWKSATFVTLPYIGAFDAQIVMSDPTRNLAPLVGFDKSGTVRDRLSTITPDAPS